MADRKSKSELGIKRVATSERAPSAVDGLLNERVSLGIVSALAVNEWLRFNDLKRLLNTSDGDLSLAAAKLEDAGYVRYRKYFEDLLPRTEYQLTVQGRTALNRYLSEMEGIISS